MIMNSNNEDVRCHIVTYVTCSNRDSVMVFNTTFNNISVTSVL